MAKQIEILGQLTDCPILIATYRSFELLLGKNQYDEIDQYTDIEISKYADEILALRGIQNYHLRLDTAKKIIERFTKFIDKRRQRK